MIAQAVNVAVHNPTQPNKYGCTLLGIPCQFQQSMGHSLSGRPRQESEQTVHLMSLSTNSTSTKTALPPCCMYDVKQKNRPLSLSSSAPVKSIYKMSGLQCCRSAYVSA
jgi:hypothetical protein